MTLAIDGQNLTSMTLRSTADSVHPPEAAVEEHTPDGSAVSLEAEGL